MTKADSRSARVEVGGPVSLEEAIAQLLPASGSVEVQRDPAGFVHPPHTHPFDETLLIVRGELTFRYADQESTCTSGHRLLLPANLLHSSVAGPEGAVYLIRVHEDGGA